MLSQGVRLSWFWFWTLMGPSVFPLISPIIVPIGTPRASPLRGEVCTAPLPTHWQLSHPVFALSFEAQLMRTPSNCIWFFLCCLCLSLRDVRHSLEFCGEPWWVSRFFCLAFTHFGSLGVTRWFWEHLVKVPGLPTGPFSSLGPALSYGPSSEFGHLSVALGLVCFVLLRTWTTVTHRRDFDLGFWTTVLSFWLNFFIDGFCRRKTGRVLKNMKIKIVMSSCLTFCFCSCLR